jgi:hypothetical protein
MSAHVVDGDEADERARAVYSSEDADVDGSISLYASELARTPKAVSSSAHSWDAMNMCSW